MDRTPRLGLPLLVPGQAQKEVFHNEALQLLDGLALALVETGPLAAPPESPKPGHCFLVAPGAGSEWLGKDNHIACWSETGWRFIAPSEGFTIAVGDCASPAAFLDGGWVVGSLRGSEVKIAGQKVVGAREPAIPDPSGGKTVDSEARQAIAALLLAVRRHGLIES